MHASIAAGIIGKDDPEIRVQRRQPTAAIGSGLLNRVQAGQRIAEHAGAWLPLIVEWVMA